MLIEINPNNPRKRRLDQVVECLCRGGVIIYPTDAGYVIGCSMGSKQAVARACKIVEKNGDKSLLACFAPDLKTVGNLAIQMGTPVYKMLKRALPGPYVFILKASKAIPKHFQYKKRFGVRVTDHVIPRMLLEMVGSPIAAIEIPVDEEQIEYNMDPDLLHDRFGADVDMVIDGGYGDLDRPTIIDCSEGMHELEIVREGKGDWQELGI